MEMINGVPRELEISLTQTAKGLFYVDRLVVRANTEKEILEKLDSTLGAVKERLTKINQEAKE